MPVSLCYSVVDEPHRAPNHRAGERVQVELHNPQHTQGHLCGAFSPHDQTHQCGHIQVGVPAAWDGLPWRVEGATDPTGYREQGRARPRKRKRAIGPPPKALSRS